LSTFLINQAKEVCVVAVKLSRNMSVESVTKDF
jgi:hypothetical protein